MAKLKAPFALDRSLNTTEQTSRNIADVLAEELSAIITAIGGLNFINFEVVAELPTTGISTTTIYLVPSDDPQSGNTYDEYINLNGTVSGWEKIGSTAIDLSGYYTSAETDALLDEKVDKDSFDEQTATDEFSTINGGLLSSCKVALSPNQDLHGYENPWVGGAGKNKADINDLSLVQSDSGNKLLISNLALTAGTYTMSFDVSKTITSTRNRPLYVISGTNTYAPTDYNTQGRGSWTFTLSADSTVTFYWWVADNSLAVDITNFMIESGSTATAYEPYSNICPITGHTQVDVDVSDGQTTQEQVTVNLGGTYYSGTLDVVTGVFTPDMAIATVSDFTFTAGKSDGDLAKVEYTPSNFKNSSEKLKCNMMPYVEQSASWSETEPCYTIANGTKLRVYFDGDTLADFQRDFADIQIVYELATPQSIQLSPTMVKALVGENHLSAQLDGQEITESKYKKMFTFDDVIAYIQSLS